MPRFKNVCNTICIFLLLIITGCSSIYSSFQHSVEPNAGVKKDKIYLITRIFFEGEPIIQNKRVGDSHLGKASIYLNNNMNNDIYLLISIGEYALYELENKNHTFEGIFIYTDRESEKKASWLSFDVRNKFIVPEWNKSSVPVYYIGDLHLIHNHRNSMGGTDQFLIPEYLTDTVKEEIIGTLIKTDGIPLEIIEYPLFRDGINLKMEERAGWDILNEYYKI